MFVSFKILAITGRMKHPKDISLTHDWLQKEKKEILRGNTFWDNGCPNSMEFE